MSNYDYNELRVLTYKTIKVMNKINEYELQEINRAIEILEAYKKGKTIEFYTSKYGWVKCTEAPFISIIRIYQYRITDKQENN